ncbi:LysE family translocator [Vibrio sp. ZSDE26]|uniref:LysE family translocator n=1 Tax=Vibrio amylolyticus TaxID=2847292 RepID=A0A9X1XPD2_9VIBR|nr:LysE family translocator [Vibrio amylolyticus]MCK6264670.1 LysE family translocator [Vibrio amylolyticus]
MTSQMLIAFLLFSISISMVPGAGNMVLLSISKRFGMSATYPFIAGNVVGFTSILLAASAGLVGVMTLYPSVFAVLKWLGTAYLVYLAWSIATMKVDENVESHRTGFTSGVLIQIFNPKGYIVSLTIFSQFISQNVAYAPQVALLTVIMALTGIVSMVFWAYLGTVLQRCIRSEKVTSVVNGLLGGSLAVVAILMAVQPL